MRHGPGSYLNLNPYEVMRCDSTITPEALKKTYRKVHSEPNDAFYPPELAKVMGAVSGGKKKGGDDEKGTEDSKRGEDDVQEIKKEKPHKKHHRKHSAVTETDVEVIEIM